MSSSPTDKAKRPDGDQLTKAVDRLQLVTAVALAASMLAIGYTAGRLQSIAVIERKLETVQMQYAYTDADVKALQKEVDDVRRTMQGSP